MPLKRVMLLFFKFSLKQGNAVKFCKIFNYNFAICMESLKIEFIFQSTDVQTPIWTDFFRRHKVNN